MPYKDPERKRQWEREHREHRNARRRMGAQMKFIVSNPAPDPIPDQLPNGAWLVVAAIGIALVVAVGLSLLAALNGASASLDSGPGSHPPDSGDSGPTRINET
jgi:hypothetical protein